MDRPETRLIGVNPSWRPGPTQTMQVVVIINWIAGRAGNPRAHSQTDRLTLDQDRLGILLAYPYCASRWPFRDL